MKNNGLSNIQINKDQIELALTRASSASNLTKSLQTTFVFRPGEPNPTANVYNVWTTLYNAFIQVQGPKIIQFDNTFTTPIIPAGIYNLNNTILSGDFKSNNNINVLLADGVIFSGLQSITNALTLISQSTSVPVFTFEDNDIILIERGSKITNDPLSTIPFFHTPSTVTSSIIVLILGGGVGDTGIHSVNIDAGGNQAFILDIFASLQTDVIAGPGNAVIIITSQAAFLNTPFPITQPAVGVLATIIFQFASFISFQTLNPANWIGTPPANVEEAINRLATTVALLNGGPIP